MAPKKPKRERVDACTALPLELVLDTSASIMGILRIASEQQKLTPVQATASADSRIRRDLSVSHQRYLAQKALIDLGSTDTPYGPLAASLALGPMTAEHV